MADDTVTNPCKSPKEVPLTPSTDDVPGSPKTMTDSELMATVPTLTEIDRVIRECDEEHDRQKAIAYQRRWHPRSIFSEARIARELKEKVDQEAALAKVAAEEAKKRAEVNDSVVSSETAVKPRADEEGSTQDLPEVSPAGAKLASDPVSKVNLQRHVGPLTSKNFNLASESSHSAAPSLESSEASINLKALPPKDNDPAYDSDASEAASSTSISDPKYTARLRAPASISDPEDFLRRSTDFVPTLTMVERRKRFKLKGMPSDEENSDEERRLREEPVMVEGSEMSADNGVSEAQQYAMPFKERLVVEVLTRVTSAVGMWQRPEPPRREKGGRPGWYSA